MQLRVLAERERQVGAERGVGPLVLDQVALGDPRDALQVLERVDARVPKPGALEGVVGDDRLEQALEPREAVGPRRSAQCRLS